MDVLGHSFTVPRFLCAECNHEQSDRADECPRCEGDMTGFACEVVRADDHRGAVDALRAIAQAGARLPEGRDIDWKRHAEWLHAYADLAVKAAEG